jgi:malonyl-CoA/methylmalonyl-CoA synthetase
MRGRAVKADVLGAPATWKAASAAWGRHLGEPPSDDLRAKLSEGSIATAAHATALRVPERPALEIDGAAITHGELDRRAAKMAGWLRARGIEPGEPLLISSPTSLGLAVAYLGALRAGTSVVLANPAYTIEELRHVVRDSRPALALAARPGLEHMRALSGTERAVRLQVVDLEALGPADPEPIAELRAAAALDPMAPAPGQPAIIAYTSGTTGTPKSVPLTDGNLLSSIRAAMLAWRWHDDDVLVHSLPLFHQHGLGGLHATLLAGSSALIRSRFEPMALCDDIAAARASVVFAVPSMYDRLSRWEAIADAQLGSLRLLVSGSAPLSPPLAERIGELVGQLPLERYGTTESGLDVSNPYDGPRHPGSVGLPLPGVELAIADEGGTPLGRGIDGEIVLRGPQVFGGYRGDPEATTEAFYAERWFRTGDIGRIDPDDGYLRITGRAKELIISGGMNVYPREVEFALEAHPGVARAAVVGIPSERWGEEVVAAVVPTAEATSAGLPDEVGAFARSRLAPYKCPKRIVLVDELPVNAVGKVAAAAVRSVFGDAG